ncbi:MAG: selenocysteine-specific translation elongation factor [Janthinobacterium lividum]
MYVVATAGHVDHGKSSLVAALTGTDPDRLAEEKRRGLTLDLGFAWTDLPGAGTVEFVDVPGHEKFVSTMLAGAGPVPVVMFVVAADGGWMPQSSEHLAALDALDVRRGLLVVTRCDLADPARVLSEARERLSGTSLAGIAALTCSSVTGVGLDDVRAALADVLAHLPAADVDAPVRLWVDRSFSIRGAGTVVTGTLSAGSITAGDALELGERTVRVRAVQSTGHEVERAHALARVALNLRDVDRSQVRRGDALLTPGAHVRTDVVDARLLGVAEVGEWLVAHLGAAAVPVRVRPLARDGDDALVRLQLDTALPLRIGDRLLLRDPARHEVAGAAIVLDVRPKPLRRRGSAGALAQELAPLDGVPDQATELRRRGVITGAALRATGVEVSGTPVVGDYHADPDAWRAWGAALHTIVDDHLRTHPLQPGPTLEEARRALELPDRELVSALVAPPLRVRDGRVVRAESVVALPPAVARAVDHVLADLAGAPFAAPDVERLAGLGLGRGELAAAVRAGRLERVADGVVLAPGFRDRAVVLVSALPQPFTASQARTALGTSRRVALPVLAALDAAGLTRRAPDDRRTVVGR